MLAPIKIKPAKKLIHFAMLFYSLTVIVVVTCTFSWPIKVLLLIFTLMNAKKYFKLHLLQNAPLSVMGLAKTQQEFWFLHFANSQIQAAFLCANSLITQFILVLNFYTQERKRLCVIVTPACIGREDYRRLLAHLYHAQVMPKA